MIDKNLSKIATAEDAKLLESVHPLGSKLLTYVGSKWRLKRIPMIGIIISDPVLIREIYLNKTAFNKNGKGASTSFWNPIIGNYGLLNMDGDEHRNLKRTVANLFSRQRVEAISNSVTGPILAAATAQLQQGNSVDVAEIAGEISYRTMWQVIGFTAEKLAEIDVQVQLGCLRSVTEGINPAKKKLSAKEVDAAIANLSVFDALVHDSYHNEKDSLPFLLKESGYEEEVATSLTKSLFIAGTETVVSFLPRMTALFIESGYLGYLAENPEHAMTGIDEALRVTVPTPVAARCVTEPVDFHGIPMKAGERLVLNTIGASKKYGDFDPFNEKNKEMKSLWFGAGVHMCIGIGIAIAQAQSMSLFLATMQKEQGLEIVSKKLHRKGHTGSYKELMIK